MPQKGYPHIPDGPKTSDELIERLNEAAAALSRLQAERDEARKALSDTFRLSEESYQALKASHSAHADDLIAELRASGARAEAAESRLAAAALRERAKDEALTAARAMIQTRETIDELSWGKRSSPATRLLAKIDAALAQPEEVK